MVERVELPTDPVSLGGTRIKPPLNREFRALIEQNKARGGSGVDLFLGEVTGHSTSSNVTSLKPGISLSREAGTNSGLSIEAMRAFKTHPNYLINRVRDDVGATYVPDDEITEISD